MQSERERAEKAISAGRDSIRDSVVSRLALARTYCEMARLANHPVRRRRLFTQACEALTTAEEFVRVAPPEFLGIVLEDAQRLRFEIGQLVEASPDQRR